MLELDPAFLKGEDWMFLVDIPTTPPQATPMVLAQADTSGSVTSLSPAYILKTCKETESTGDPQSAMRAVSPAAMLRNYLQNRDGDDVELSSIKGVSLLERTKHGDITSEIGSGGVVGYWYNPTPGYIGQDKAVFMAEYQGICYKIVVDLRVFTIVNENDTVCPPPQLIKVTKPSAGSNGYDLNSVTFANLVGAAIGQTTITLDINDAATAGSSTQRHRTTSRVRPHWF